MADTKLNKNKMTFAINPKCSINKNEFRTPHSPMITGIFRTARVDIVLYHHNNSIIYSGR